MAIGKTEMVERLSKRMSVSKAEAQRFLDAFQEEVSGALAKGQEVNLTGFGKFTVSRRAARDGVNPRNGQPMKIGPTTTPRFKPGSKLKGRVG